MKYIRAAQLLHVVLVVSMAALSSASKEFLPKQQLIPEATSIHHPKATPEASTDPNSLASLEASMPLEPGLVFENRRLQLAYIALQSWKAVMISDPSNFTSNWVGSDVCSYNGVFCANLPGCEERTVAGVDMGRADIAAHLPPQLGLLTDLSLFHLASNRFCGSLPDTFAHMNLLFELDLSSNRFVGAFPQVLIDALPSLKFVDLRFNDFEGPIPPALFDKPLDAIFLNNNRFTGGIPTNLGNSPVSALVLANNKLGGCIPSSITAMGKTLNELVLLNDHLTGCLPYNIGRLTDLTVFDVSFNSISGPIPHTISQITSLEELDLSHNQLTGTVPAAACELPFLQNFTYSYNFLTAQDPVCASTIEDEIFNCIAGEPNQRTHNVCSSSKAMPVDCRIFKCYTPPPSPPSPAFDMSSSTRSHPPPSYYYPPVTYTSPPPPPESYTYTPATYSSPTPPPYSASYYSPEAYSSPKEYSPETPTAYYGSPSSYASPSPILPYN